MSETKQLLEGKKAITPLWIVALFVSLTELVLGAAVTQTAGGIQVALTVFVIAFPVLIAGSFFLTLWHKPYVFYPPTEFGHQINVGEYVEAMQRRPALLQQSAEASMVVNQTKDNIIADPLKLAEKSKEEAEAVVAFKDGVVDNFVKTMSASGMLALYACSVAHTTKKPFSAQELFSTGLPPRYDYANGFVVAAGSIGLIDVDETKGIWNVTYFNESLKKELPARLDTIIAEYQKGDTQRSNSKLAESVLASKNAIDEYFSE